MFLYWKSASPSEILFKNEKNLLISNPARNYYSIRYYYVHGISTSMLRTNISQISATIHHRRNARVSLSEGPQPLDLPLFPFFLPLLLLDTPCQTRAIGSRHKRQVRVLISLEPIARPVSRFRSSDRPEPSIFFFSSPLFIRHRVPHPLFSFFLFLFLSLSLSLSLSLCRSILRSNSVHRLLHSRMLRNLRFWIMLPSRWSNDRSIGSGLPSSPVSALRLASTCYRCHFQSHRIDHSIFLSFPCFLCSRLREVSRIAHVEICNPANREISVASEGFLMIEFETLVRAFFLPMKQGILYLTVAVKIWWKNLFYK